MLAVLLARAGHTVSADRLVDEIWGERPPRTAHNTVQGYVMRLRRLLGADANDLLLTRNRGYQVTVADEELDAVAFKRLLESGQRDLGEGRLHAAAGELAAALALWHGPAFADVPATSIVTAETARLEQYRLTALETRLDTDLALGRHGETVDELHRLTTEYPLRERLRELLMLALYRCGRRAEALEAYSDGRAMLVKELGLEPGPELRRLEQDILADDPGLLPGTGTITTTSLGTPAQLPADIGGFTGRQAQLDRLDELIANHDNATTVVLSAIAGTAGVGKTALAVHWAHRVRDRFPDGQLHVDLRGYSTGTPVRPIEALSRFLRALGVAADQVPVDVDEAAALYRSLLADRRMIVVLDNAFQPDQVRPLLPGASGCLVLVTSRSALAGLVARDGAHELTLDVLTAKESGALLRGLLGAERTDAQPRATAELAELCAHLPLALRIAAAQLLAQPKLAIAGYVAQLRAGDRLDSLRVAGDEQAAVLPAFAQSYSALPDDTRRLFRLLGSAPGFDVTAEAAAALADISHHDAGARLARLAAGHLLEEHTPGRYGCHDLLRQYARERGRHEDTESELDSALRRLYDWYLHAVDAAAAMLYPQMRRMSSHPTQDQPRAANFDDHTDALAWLDAERANLVAAVTHAAEHRPWPVAGLIAESLRGYFWLRMYTVDWLAVASAGQSIAESTGDPNAATAALLSLADINFRQGHHREATEYSARALAIARHVGWQPGMATALSYLGNLHLLSGRLTEALEHHEQALTLNRRAGRLPKQGSNLLGLGRIHRQLGSPKEALFYLTHALSINRKLESASGEADVLYHLGAAWGEIGDLGEAADLLRHALRMAQEVGHRGLEAEARVELATVHREAGRYTVAFEEVTAGLELARDANDRPCETDALHVLGTIHQRHGNHTEAARYYRLALDLARDTGYRFTEAKTLIGLAVVCHEPEHARQAAAIADEAGYRTLTAEARRVIDNFVHNG
nr:BTAD domain-containing putative transcriptional regulator [Kibdelosporangium sp. MJ126-NF4]